MTDNPQRPSAYYCGVKTMGVANNERDGTHGGVTITDAVGHFGFGPRDPVQARIKKSNGETFSINRPLSTSGTITIPVTIRERESLTVGDAIEVWISPGIPDDYDGPTRTPRPSDDPEPDPDQDSDTPTPTPADTATDDIEFGTLEAGARDHQADLDEAVTDGSGTDHDQDQDQDSGEAIPITASFALHETDFHLSSDGSDQALCGWSTNGSEDYDTAEPSDAVRFRTCCHNCLREFFATHTTA